MAARRFTSPNMPTIDQRGAATGWIQSSASIGLLAALGVIVATRTMLGTEAFDAWGWRIPFLASAILLAISLWMRLKLSESPTFAKLREEGTTSKAPLREAFARSDSLKQVLIAFFAIMCAQGAVWYFTFFYMQVFLEKSLGMPGRDQGSDADPDDPGVSAPLYVFFGWLSRPRRPQAGDARRDAARARALFPRLALDRPGGQSGAGPRRRRRPRWWSRTDLATCSSQFDPTGTAKFTSACDIAKSILIAARRRLHERKPRPTARPRVSVGGQARRRSPAAKGQGRPQEVQDRHRRDRSTPRWPADGYPKSADPAAIDYPILLLVLLGFVIAASAVYGPQAAALVEMFPTRIRYTAMSLPYHVGTGWVGGFLPVTSFAIVALTGDIYAGLWYAVGFTALSAVVTILFLKETRGKPLEEC